MGIRCRQKKKTYEKLDECVVHTNTFVPQPAMHRCLKSCLYFRDKM